MQLIYLSDKTYPSSLAHHGILGMRWGVRRYQNKDGSLTSAGQRRYGGMSNKQWKKEKEAAYKEQLEKSSKNTEIKKKKLESEAYGLLKKYKFDGDDGGNADTPEAEKAAKRYMDIWDKIDMLDEERYREANKKSVESLINKYGKETYSELEAREKRRGTIKKIAAIVGAVSIFRLGVGLALTKGASH